VGLGNPLHILLLVLVVVLVFGARRLPELGRSLGEGVRGFKDSLKAGAPQQASLTPAPAPRPTPDRRLVRSLPRLLRLLRFLIARR
jgi:sec-independent protein translocase protein TatA